MFEPTQRQVDSDLEQSMALFKRAEVGRVPALKPIQPRRVLLALDGSSQDALGTAIASRLRDRLGCEVAVADIDGSSADVTAVARELAADQVTAQGQESYDRILTAVTDWDADLLVVPCPFGRDFASVGADSTGTVIDVLLARSPVPIIATRSPFDPQGDVFSRLRMVLRGENEAAPAAAHWAVGLVHPEGQLELSLVVEEEFYENVREAMHAIQPDADISMQSLENALARMHARLHVGLERSSREIGFGYELIVERESEAAPFTIGDPSAHPPLLVLALERDDHSATGHVHDQVRRSPHPVLVVPA